MIELGKFQTLTIVKTTDFGVYLNSADEPAENKVLLPKSQVPKEAKIGDEVQVFIYRDSEDRLIATTTSPHLTLGGLAVLKVIEVTAIGAFLDWGLVKDLLLPFKEQTEHVQINEEVLVSLYIDKSDRLCATMKVYNYLIDESPYEKGQRVSGRVYELSDEFGAFVAIDDKYSALIPAKELHKTIKPGDLIEARVTSIREDGKLNLSIREKIPVQMDEDAQLILNILINNNGTLPFNDKSTPDDIKEKFGLSKNAYKRALGRLLKERKILITDSGITYVPSLD